MVPTWRYGPTIAGDETLLQLRGPPSVANRQATWKSLVSMAQTTPAPSITYAFPSLTTGAVKTASLKGMAASSPSGAATLRSGTLPLRSASNLSWRHSSAPAAGRNARPASARTPNSRSRLAMSTTAYSLLSVNTRPSEFFSSRYW